MGDAGLFDGAVLARAARLLAACRAQGWRLATAESCTGGLVAAALTAIAGASDVFVCAFVAYDNDAKVEMLGVDAALIRRHGAVSEEVARAMAEGALQRRADRIAIAVTGIAGPGGTGPGGAGAGKPAGLVHIAAARPGATLHRMCRYGDIGRGAVRMAAVADALDLALALAEG